MIKTLGMVEVTLACVLIMLGSVEMTDASVDCTEASVQITDGASSCSSWPPIRRFKSSRVKSKSGSGVPGLSSPVLLRPRYSTDFTDSIVTVELVSKTKFPYRFLTQGNVVFITYKEWVCSVV